MAKKKTRRRFVNAASTHDADFLAAHKAARRGEDLTEDQKQLLESVEVEVVDIETISGPRRVFADKVADYERAGVIEEDES